MSSTTPLAEAAQSPLDQLGLHCGLSYGDVESNLLQANREGGLAHRRIAFYLNELHERGLYQMSGHASAVHWAANRLGMCDRSARELIITGRRLLELQELDAEFAAGGLSWSKVRRLASKATVATQREWIELARQLTCRELELQLLRSKDGQPPRGDRLGIGQVRFKVQAILDTLAYEEWELAKRKLGDELGLAVGDGELIREAARLILQTNADGSVAGRRPVQESHYKIVVRCDLERDTAEVVTEAGPIPVPTATVSMLLDAGARLEREPGADAEHPPGRERVPAGEHELKREAEPHAGSASAPLSKSPDKPPPTSAPLRRAILARDGHLCRSCRSRRRLHVHHVTFREHGGPTTPSNLLTACSRCHTLVHEGLLNIEGRVPDKVRFLDSRGLPINRWYQVGPVASVTHAQPPREPALEPRRSLSPRIVRFDDLPQRADAEWWQRHQHLLRWNERRRVLEFHAGVPVDPPVEPPVQPPVNVAHVRHPRPEDPTSGSGFEPTPR